MRLVLQKADPRLGKFNPLQRILFYDDFDEGLNGWCELIGNHDGRLDQVRSIIADCRPPQLSSCTFFDIGAADREDGASGHGTAPEDYHVIRPDDWRAVPGGDQQLCYNETPTKINWYYLR
jgi:hypothetical protein